MAKRKSASSSEPAKPHPDHAEHLKKLNRVIGQLEGIKRMIEGRRYCPDILTQTRAAMAAIKSVELSIFEKHLGHCVSDAMNSEDPANASSKISELVNLVKRF